MRTWKKLIGKRLLSDTAQFRFSKFLSQVVAVLEIVFDFLTFLDPTNRESQMALGKVRLFISLNMFCYFVCVCVFLCNLYVDYALNGRSSIISTSLNGTLTLCLWFRNIMILRDFGCRSKLYNRIWFDLSRGKCNIGKQANMTNIQLFVTQ